MQLVSLLAFTTGNQIAHFNYFNMEENKINLIKIVITNAVYLIFLLVDLSYMTFAFKISIVESNLYMKAVTCEQIITRVKRTICFGRSLFVFCALACITNLVFQLPGIVEDQFTVHGYHMIIC